MTSVRTGRRSRHRGTCLHQSRCSRLAGKARGIPFQVTRPFAVRHRAGGLSVDNALVAIGNGRIELGGQLSPALDARLVLTRLPLQAFAQIASVDGLGGALSGTVRLTGEPSMVNGRFDVTGTSVNFAQLQAQGIKPLSFDAAGSLASNVLTFKGSARSGSDLSASANGRIDIGPGGSINLTIQGKAGNRVFTDRLAREGIRLEGAAIFDLTVTGNFSDPAINGTVGSQQGDVRGYGWTLHRAQRFRPHRPGRQDGAVRFAQGHDRTKRDGRAEWSGRAEWRHGGQSQGARIERRLL